MSGSPLPDGQSSHPPMSPSDVGSEGPTLSFPNERPVPTAGSSWQAQPPRARSPLPSPGPGAAPPSLPPLREQLLRRFTEQAALPALFAEPAASPTGGRWLSYGQLGALVNRTANALAAAGARPGMRVGVMLANGEPFVQAWLALALLNVTMMPVNVNLVGVGLHHVLLHADLDLLLLDAAYLDAVLEACAGIPPARRLLVWQTGSGERGAGAGAGFPDERGASVLERAGFPPAGGAGISTVDQRAPDQMTTDFLLPFAALLADASADAPPPLNVDPADPALIIYTSGTTGPSKGVVLSRMAQLWHARNYLDDFIRVGPGETGYTPLPLFHVSAQGFTLGCLLGGAAVAVGARFQPFSFWESLRRHNAKTFNYVGAMIPLLYHRRPRSDDRDNPAERAVGSATMPELHEPFERRFGLRLIESYGQTETAGLWLAHPDEGRRIGTIGTPRRWLAATILRPDGSEAAADERGEIALRPANPRLMTEGYFRDAQTTAEAFRDGWYHTGDAGSRDTDGSFRFAGRLKDFIRRRGENISAFEIEREALTHPAVAEAAAVGVPSALGEDDVKLCVRLHEGATLDPAELHRHLRARLAAFMRPRYIEVRDDFPRTPTQRVQKHHLRDEGVPASVWERASGRRAEPPITQ